jgi:hypothetical protein
MATGVTTKGSLPRLQRTNELKASYATILGYGPARGGKTRSVERCHEAGLNPVIIATELGETSGLLSLASSPIAFIKVTSHAEIIEVLKEMQRKPGKIEYEQTEFGMAVLDSITQWGDWPLDRFVEIKGWGDLATPASSKDPRSAYGYLAEKGRQLYKELFALHGHVYVIAREGIFGNGEEIPFFAAPELPGQKLPREVPGWPDATIRLRVVAGRYRMITQAEGNTPCGVRTPSGFPPLPRECNNDIPALIRYMTGDRSAYTALVPEKPQAGNKPAVQQAQEKK